ncbi:MAG: hypothetical protein R2867_06910 [Caldilineaceae bacterium]
MACVPINTEQALTNLARQQANNSFPPAIEPVGAEGAIRDEAMTVADGTVISYTIVLPPSYTAGQEYPTLLALPPGSQTQNMVTSGLSSYWQAGALANGWVVVSPVAPNGRSFFRALKATCLNF